MSGACVTIDAAVGEGEARRDAQLVGEDGELVGLAVAVGVLADDDAVAPLPRGLALVGVVDRLGDPQPARSSQVMQIGR